MSKKDLIFNLFIGGVAGVMITTIALNNLTPAENITPETTCIEVEIVTTTTKVEPETTTESETTTELAFTPYESIPLPDDLQRDIYNRCERHLISYDLALAIIKTESDFITDAVGDGGNATGLCQIWAKWWGELATEQGLDIDEPADNVELMLIILNQHLDACEGDLTEALQMYNTGKPYGDKYANRVYKNLELIESEVK